MTVCPRGVERVRAIHSAGRGVSNGHIQRCLFAACPSHQAMRENNSKSDERKRKKMVADYFQENVSWPPCVVVVGASFASCASTVPTFLLPGITFGKSRSF